MGSEAANVHLGSKRQVANILRDLRRRKSNWLRSAARVTGDNSKARGRRQRLIGEMAAMKELPERRMESARREQVKVDSGSLIYVDRNVYSVPSRLIGEQVEARLQMDQVEIWYGQKKVAQLPRLRGRHKHRVDYRHIID